MNSFFKQKLLVGLVSTGTILVFALTAYAASVLDGGVSVDVSDYNAVNGWTAGVIYDVKVTANFADVTSENKRVIITLPEGMRFTAYPVIGTPISGSPGYQIDTSSALGQFITSVSPPPKQAYYPSYNGSLIYDLTQACESVEIPFKVTVDENVYYGPKNITDGIRSIASKNGSSIGDARMDVNAVGSVTFTLTSSTWVDPTLALTGSSDAVVLPLVNMYRAGLLYPKPFFVKQMETYYYYPKEVAVASVSDPGAVVEINTTDGYIFSQWNNQFSTTGNGSQRPSISAQNTPAGLYTAIDTLKFQATMYDGTVIPINSGYRVRINVLAGADNKLDLTATSVNYYEYTDDYMISGPRFRIFSNQVNVKERQYVEYAIDPNYEVIQAVFPKDPTIGTIGEVQYKTNLNATTQVATPAQIIALGSTAFYISKDSLGLSANEYITYARASIGSVSKGFASIGASYVYLNTSARIVGKLKDGITTTSNTIKTFALLAGGDVEANSETVATVAVNRVANPTASLRATSAATTMDAGQTKKVSFVLTGSTYYYSDQLGLINPTAYIRVPKNTQVNLSTIKVTSDYDGVLPITVTGPYVSAVSGETFVKVAATGKVGSLFDLKTYTITLSFDLVAGLAAGDNYDWSQYVFWRDDIGNNYTAQNGYPAVVSDTLDVDNDGTVTERLVPAYNYILSIIPKEEIIIDTYIVPEGESRKPAYDGTAATAVGFTPGTTAKYTLEILNNRTDTAEEIRAYIPVPKEGNNFGTQFQNNPFYWNMKLSGVPTVRVYDLEGNDITATAGSNYALSYSSDATDENNYTTATYGTTVNDSITMIRMLNTSTIAAHEKAIIEFDYVVDETVETVAANPEKLGAINDFRPYYYFNAGAAGWQNGTRVGSMLQIGQIAGSVFIDDDKNGLYAEEVDAPVPNKIINLYKKNISDAYVLLTSTTTDADGTYTFDGLSNGVYRVDFNAALSTNQEFTLKDQGANDEIDSDIAYNGSAKGFVDNIDPTNNMSKYVSAGIIEYSADEDLIVTLNKNTTNIKMTNAQTIFTEQLVGTIFPDYFDKIKTINGITWSSSDPMTVSVSNGLIQGSRTGTAVITFSATDIYGHTKNATCLVTVISNGVPTIQASDKVSIVGTQFDPRDGVSATDAEDGDITSNIVIKSNNVNENLAGTYAVTYNIEDSDGNIVEKTVSITYVAAIAQVSTLHPSNITENGATLNGNVLDAGGSDVERFIEWGTESGIYTTSCNSGLGGEGSYSCDAKNLSSNTTYYYRARVSNTAGIINGEEIQFSTDSDSAETVTTVETQGSISVQGDVYMGDM